MGLSADKNAQCVNLKWSMSVNTGGGTISSYIVEKSENGGPWTSATSASATVPVTGGPRYDFAESLTLPIRKAYTFRAAAVNEAGQGPYSNIAGPIILCACDDTVDGGAGGAAPQPLDDCGSCATDGGTANAGFTGAAGECDEQSKSSSSSSSAVAIAFKVCTDLGDCLAFTGIGTPIPDCVACPTPCAATVVTSGKCQYDVPRLNVKNGAGGRVTTYTGPTKTAGYSGNITVSCNNGTLATTNVTCVENNCTAQRYAPTNQACAYDIPDMVAGQGLFVNTSTAGYSGTITAVCRAGTITFTQTTNTTACTELPCAYTEQVSPTGCTFAAGPLNSRQTVSASLIRNTRTNYTGQPYTGSATATCLRGAITFTNIVCNSNCLGAVTTYNTCNFTTGLPFAYVLTHNAVRDYNSTNNPNTVSGTATAVCNNGTTQWQAQSCTGAPAAPVLSATKGDTVANVTWTQGGDGGAPVTNFELLYSTAPTIPNNSSALFPNGSARAATVAGLTNYTTYYMKIRATNGGGFTSPWSNTVTVTPCGAPTPAALVSATMLGTGVTIRYTCPPALPIGIPAPTLTAERSTDNGATWTTFATLQYTAGATLDHTTTTGFNGKTRTAIRIRTTIANCGTAVSSDTKIAVNRPCQPGAATARVAASCSGRLSVSWTAPGAGASCGPVTGYKVQCSSNGGATWATDPATYSGTSGSFSPVYNGLSYRCRAIAYNEAGEGPAGINRGTVGVAVSTPPGYAPVTIGATTSSTISITWLAAYVGRGNAGAVTGYSIYRRETNNPLGTYTYVGFVGGTVRAYTVSGLKPNTSYNFNVIASNLCGVGPDDGWSGAGTTTGPTPSAPSLTATPPAGCSASDAGGVSLSWTAATTAVGVPAVTNYTLQRSLNNTTWTTITTTGTNNRTYVDDSGSPGTTYYYRVFANNTNGASSPSNTASAVMPALLPSAPQNLTVTPANRSAVLTWGAPAVPGAAGSLTYRVEFKLETASNWSTAAGAVTATSYTLTNLQNGQLYFVRVSARNSVCPSNGDPTSESVTPFDPICTCPGASYSDGGCNFSFPSQPRNSTRTVSFNSGGYSGSATRQCYNACGSSVTNSNCTFTPPQVCTLSTQSRDNCVYPFSGTTPYNSNKTVNNTASNYIGSATGYCDFTGNFSITSYNCTPVVSGECKASRYTPGSTCYYDFPDLQRNTVLEVNNANPGYTGRARRSCSAAGVVFNSEVAACTAVGGGGGGGGPVDPPPVGINECYYILNDARQWVLYYQDCTIGQCPTTNSLNPGGIPTGQTMGPYRSCS